MIGNREFKQYAITLCEVVSCLLLEGLYKNSYELQMHASNNHFLSSEAAKNEQLSISSCLEARAVHLQ